MKLTTWTGILAISTHQKFQNIKVWSPSQFNSFLQSEEFKERKKNSQNYNTNHAQTFILTCLQTKTTPWQNEYEHSDDQQNKLQCETFNE